MTPLATYVVETLVTLLAVLLLAVLILYGARRAGLGRPAGPLQLVGKLPLDGRRAVYLVRVDKTVYVVGASEAGLSKLGELEDVGQLPEPMQAPKRSFSDVLSRVLQRDRSDNLDGTPAQDPLPGTRAPRPLDNPPGHDMAAPGGASAPERAPSPGSAASESDPGSAASQSEPESTANEPEPDSAARESDRPGSRRGHD